MKRGSVHWINLEPANPPETRKVRPGIVVSSSQQNEHLDSVVVVPLSSRAPEIWPLRLAIKIAGLRTSYAVVPAIRQVSKSRLHAAIGQAPAPALEQLGEALALYLGD
jgi:mRNA interferase MazF